MYGEVKERIREANYIGTIITNEYFVREAELNEDL